MWLHLSIEGWFLAQNFEIFGLFGFIPFFQKLYKLGSNQGKKLILTDDDISKYSLYIFI